MQNSVTFGILFVLSVAISLGYMEENVSTDPLVKAFNSLTAEEKPEFLRYFLVQGLRAWKEDQPRGPKLSSKQDTMKAFNISEIVVEKYEKLNIPKDSTLKLLKWTKTKFNYSTKNIMELLKKQCPKGNCLPDVGELCCPW